MSIWVIAVTFAALVAVMDVLIRRVALKGLEYRRRFSRLAYFEGETADMIEIVRNDRPMLLPWLRVESRIPRSFVFGKQEDLDVKGEMYHRSVFTLMPYQQITRRHHVRMTHRGAYGLGNATLTAGDLFGSTQAHREIRLNIPVIVYPRLLDEEELPPRFAQLMGDLVTRRSLLSDPFLVSGIRPYQTGDNIRDIHWAATARMQELEVRVHDHTSQTRLLVLINGQLREDQWDGAMNDDQPALERLISMAATMCVTVLRAGLTAGFGADLPMGEERRNTLLLPSAGAAREEEILSAMARLRMVMSRTFVAFLEELQDLKGLDIVILSLYDSEPIRERMRALELQGNTVQLYLCDGEVARGA